MALVPEPYFLVPAGDREMIPTGRDYLQVALAIEHQGERQERGKEVKVSAAD